MVYFYCSKTFLVNTTKFQDQIYAFLICQINVNRDPLISPQPRTTSLSNRLNRKIFVFGIVFPKTTFFVNQFFHQTVNRRVILITTNEYRVRNKIRHFVYNSFIDNIYQLINIKIHKCSLLVKFVHHPCTKINIILLKQQNSL